jgi:hypothetical protein
MRGKMVACLTVVGRNIAPKLHTGNHVVRIEKSRFVGIPEINIVW